MSPEGSIHDIGQFECSQDRIGEEKGVAKC